MPQEIPHKYELTPSKRFEKDVKKLTNRDKSLKKKLDKALDKLESDPFIGVNVKESKLEQKRIWVGDSHRLTYDIDNDTVLLLRFVRKDKDTYKILR